MPEWAGKWKGGRYYYDADDKPVYFIERRGRVVRLLTRDEEIANGQLGQFLEDPGAFAVRPDRPEELEPVYVTTERLNLYMGSIRKSVEDHRKARRSQLLAWSKLGLDLRRVDKKALRAALASFDGGHTGRAESLNAFARFLVKEGELPSWNPIRPEQDPGETRAARQAYSLEELRETWARLPAGPVRDLFLVRAATGLHQTEIDQVEGARLYDGPLPDKGTGIRTLPEGHEIAGVVQVMHKSRRRHRQSVSAEVLAAVLRLRAGVPYRVTVWKALAPITPSNLRHTFATLSAEVGEVVTYKVGGVDRSRIAAAMGHRAGSTMGPDRYDKLQVPPMVRLPLGFP